MKKLILALLGAALTVTVTTRPAQADTNRKPDETSVVGYLDVPGQTHLTKYGKRTSLGKEARKRLGHGGSSLRLDKHTVVSYIGTVKLKYVGTAKRKPSKNSEQVIVRSFINKDRFHVYRFNYNAK
jgi:hypothetical protein